jgi:hypothetical protein
MLAPTLPGLTAAGVAQMHNGGRGECRPSL